MLDFNVDLPKFSLEGHQLTLLNGVSLTCHPRLCFSEPSVTITKCQRQLGRRKGVFWFTLLEVLPQLLVPVVISLCEQKSAPLRLAWREEGEGARTPLFPSRACFQWLKDLCKALPPKGNTLRIKGNTWTWGSYQNSSNWNFNQPWFVLLSTSFSYCYDKNALTKAI